MAQRDRTNHGDLCICSERLLVVHGGHQAFGHSHAITPNAHCSFLLWAQEQKSYIAVQSL
jgi:hypothetical protein